MLKSLIVIPTLNEASNISRVIHQLCTEDPDGEKIPIWIVDGGSEDSTLDLVAGLKLKHVKVIENPERTQAHALNLAAVRAAESGGVEVIIRADAHANYPSGFVHKVLKAMEDTGSDSIVVPMKTVGGNRLQDAAALVFGSFLGNGGSPHRTGSVRGCVDHGHHAAFKLESFLKTRGYDTDFQANEDAEYDYRLVASGGRIFLENEAVVEYLPRDSVLATYRQFKRNGKYRVRRAIKHGVNLGLRQRLPAALVPVLAISTLLAALLSPVFLAIPVGYVVLVGAVAALLALQTNKLSLWLSVACIAFAAHLGFSIGACGAIIHEWLRSDREFLRADHPRLIKLKGGK